MHSGRHPAKNVHPITIGLLMNNMNDPNGNALWRGVASVLQENNCNLVCYAGGSPGNPNEDDQQRAILYDLVDTRLLDGLLVRSGPINAYQGQDKAHAFFEKFSPLPLISIAMQVNGVPTLTFDNYQGMCDVVTHLVQEHGRRRIVFIKGPEEHQESNIRYQAYQDALAYCHIALDPQLVLPGGFEARFGEMAVSQLVENHIDFDAIVTNDDTVAIAAMLALQRYRYDVPRQVSVVGFEDQAAAECAEIPLTTVHIPNFEMGQRAARLLLKIIRDDPLDHMGMIPLQLLIRQSCGCISPAVEQARLLPFTPLQESFPESLLKRREDVTLALYLAVGNTPWAEKVIQNLFDAFMHDLLVDQTRPSHAFLGELTQLLKSWSDMERDVLSLQKMITTMRRQMLPALAAQGAVLSEAENLWQQARVLIAEFDRRLGVRRQINSQNVVLTLHTINQALITTQYFDQLAEVVVNYLPRLDFESVYLSLFEDPSDPLSWSRLKIAYEKGRTIVLDHDGVRFNSQKLMPDNILRRKGGQSWVVMPLHFHQEKLGFVLLKMGPLDGMIYETVRYQLSSALKGISLQKRLMDLLLTDALTSIGNRRSFEMFLKKEVERHQRYHTDLSLIMVDLDEFKQYNDTFGHPSGDQALIEVANIISSCARRGLDVVVRLGGDEFAALLTETSAEGAGILGESMRQKIESSPRFLKKMTVSVGVTAMLPGEHDSKSLIARCDRALYQSKRSGRNRVTILTSHDINEPAVP